MLTLSALNGQDKGRVFQLTGEQPELMGRQAPTIKLTDAQTSRRHAEIILQNNTWLIRDLGSTNGTWVNGQRITQITELEVGDRLVVGRHQFRVSAIDNLPAPTPQPKAPQPEPAIGHEDLAAIGAGVDLSESLSADLLDDDNQEVAQAPDEASGDSGIRPTTTDAQPADTKQDDEDGLIDLDALLGDVIAEEPDESPAPESTVEQSVTPPATDQPAAPIDTDDEDEITLSLETDDQQASTPEGEVNLDEVLALDHGDDADEPLVEPQAAPAEEASSDIPPSPTDDTPDTPDVSNDINDDVLDLDAVLDDLTPDHDAAEAGTYSQDDQLSTARPIDTDLYEGDQEPDENEPAQDDENTQDDSPDSDDATQDDSLIDIDILASAKPAADWQGEVSNYSDVPEDTEPSVSDLDLDDEHTTDDAPSDEIEDVDEILGDLATDLDEAPGVLRDELADSGLDFDADAADAQASSHDTDASMDVEDEDTEEAGIPDEDDNVLGQASTEVRDAEKDLLLSPQEQEKAVTGYRRSKIKSLVGLVLLLAALGAAGWYGFNYYVNHANATSTQSTPAPANPAVSGATPTTKGRTDSPPPANIPAPQHQQTPQGEPAGSVPAPTPRRTPVQAAPSQTNYPDPFADIAPEFNTPQADKTKPEPPAEAEAIEPTPVQPQPEPAPQPQPEPETKTSTPSQPQTDSATARDDAAAPQTDTDNKPAPEAAAIAAIETPAPNPGSTFDTIHEPTTTTTTPPTNLATPKDELALITGVIDAQNSPGDRVTGQAEYAGARKVVYLVDASGSLVDSFPHVLAEMNRAIGNLTGDKAFTVVFFGSDGIIEVPPVGLKWADNQNKQQVREWVAPDQGNVNAWGRGDLIQALQHALEYNPDDLVILTDNLTGRQSSQEAIDEMLARIETLVDGKVEKVHVMQFFDRDPQQVLKTIAERFHGTYRRIANKPSTAAQSSVDPLAQP